ncbi:hypothetical protein GCM10028895_01580 [Pontibacter rugosus]
MPMGDSNTQGNSSNDQTPRGSQIAYRKALYDRLLEAERKFKYVGSETTGEVVFNNNDNYIHHAGIGGARDEDWASILEQGFFMWYNSETDKRVYPYPYLEQYSPDLILLHIGTNSVDDSDGASDDINRILTEIDEYELSSGLEVTVVLAQIINQAPITGEGGVIKNKVDIEKTPKFNLQLEKLYKTRLLAGDRIELVNMESDANIIYKNHNEGGDFLDQLHLTGGGYAKMAQVWFDAISPLLAPNAVLPVEIASFNASAASSGEVILNWSTASEEENDRFEVERMQEGQPFKAIGKVAGAGNSNHLLRYTYHDASAPTGEVYYRLRQVDTDGTFTYSKVVSVSLQHAAESSVAYVYPNPTSGSEAIRIFATGFAPGTPVTMRLFDAFGRELFKQEASAASSGNLHTSAQWPTSLSKGLYIVQLASSGSVQKLKFIIK